jgi:hypothetical protein
MAAGKRAVSLEQSFFRRFGRAAVVLRAILASAMLAAPAAVQAQAPPPVNLDEPDRSATLERLRLELPAGRSFALVIGISEFRSTHWSPLPGARAEAAAVAAALKLHGFQIEPVLDGAMTGEGLRRTVMRFIADRGGDSDNRLVIYIASHGHPEKSSAPGGDIGHVIAHDSSPPGLNGRPENTLSVREIASDLAKARARHILLAFNTCFSGALVPDGRNQTPATEARRAPSTPFAPEFVEWIGELQESPARFVMTAGTGEETVPDRDNPFHRAFVEGLLGGGDVNGDGVILASELAQYVRQRVAVETRRAGSPNSPLFVAIPADGKPATMKGDFVFLSPRGPAREDERLDDRALERRRAALKLLAGEASFADCLDCPAMTRLPGPAGATAAAGQAATGKVALATRETTFQEWDACYREGYCARWKAGEARGDRPVGGVSWFDARDFIGWLNRRAGADRSCAAYRLPTAAEWVYAARAGARTRLPWGDAPEANRANCAGCNTAWSGREAAPTGRTPANAYGLYDMIGNVWEWVDDPARPCGASAASCKPGLVMGGGFSTAITGADLSKLGGEELKPGPLVGEVPRAARSLAEVWPTIGLRVACDLAD